MTRSATALGSDGAILWVVLAAVLGTALAIDFWFHRRPRHIPFAEGVRWTAVWTATAGLFGVVILATRGASVAGQFFAVYVTEWSLSIDNILVFVVLISSLAVPREMRHRVLLVGALGAIVLRLAFVIAGVALVHQFAWLTYGFGVMLLLLGAKLGWPRRTAAEEAPPFQGISRRLTARASPLVAALVLVVIADIAFAVDSIPAAFSLSLDPFIVFSANALAVLGLRSLYFVVEGAIHRFRYLRPALGILLVFVSVKMLLGSIVEVSIGASLAVIVGILGTAALLSWFTVRSDKRWSAGASTVQSGHPTVGERSVAPGDVL
ncbi:MAG: tellurium resistance protein TerC [Candidatus Dormibacter sp.]